MSTCSPWRYDTSGEKDETLTVMRFGLPRSRERVPSTTNAIENLIGSVRRLGDRVKHWRGGQMILRWTVTAVVDAATRFRRITVPTSPLSSSCRHSVLAT